jgi:hypothetical protein
MRAAAYVDGCDALIPCRRFCPAAAPTRSVLARAALPLNPHYFSFRGPACMSSLPNLACDLRWLVAPILPPPGCGYTRSGTRPFALGKSPHQAPGCLSVLDTQPGSRQNISTSSLCTGALTAVFVYTRIWLRRTMCVRRTADMCLPCLLSHADNRRLHESHHGRPVEPCVRPGGIPHKSPTNW